MTHGSVRKLIADRGYGFISGDDGKDCFFHHSGLEAPLNFDRLAVGARVAFEIEANPRGLRAVQVRAA